LAGQGGRAVAILAERLRARRPETGRVHALWALDEIAGAEARHLIRNALQDPSAALRLQAARSVQKSSDRESRSALEALLADADPAVRREAAIALGAIGDRAATARLLEALGESDRFTSWSVKAAIRRLGYPDEAAVQAALLDPRSRESALDLADESFSVPVVKALVAALRQASGPALRARIIVSLGGQYRRYPEWLGTWWGPDPLSVGLPRKTREWDPEGMSSVLEGLRIGSFDPNASVRFQSIVELGEVGAAGGAILRAAIAQETDTRNQALAVEELGKTSGTASIRLLIALLSDGKRAASVRTAALDGLARFRSRDAVRARLAVLYDPLAPESLSARALPPLAREGILPMNEMASLLESPKPLVRAAALLSLNVSKPLPGEIKQMVLNRIDDSSTDVRQAAMIAAAALGLREAVPRLVSAASAGQENADLRTQAITALCKMPDLRAASIYRLAASDPDPSLRAAGAEALRAIAGQVDAHVNPAGGSGAPSSRAGEMREFALRHLADARKGEELFFENRQIACGRCHAAAGRGADKPGPSLDGVGSRFDKKQLVDCLLTPSLQVARAHESIKNLASTLTPLEFTDLVGFLERLKQSPRAGTQ
jgi:HEAT repeat protein